MNINVNIILSANIYTNFIHSHIRCDMMIRAEFNSRALQSIYDQKYRIRNSRDLSSSDAAVVK